VSLPILAITGSKYFQSDPYRLREMSELVGGKANWTKIAEIVKLVEEFLVQNKN
jgi:hypothetical protein